MKFNAVVNNTLKRVLFEDTTIGGVVNTNTGIDPTQQIVIKKKRKKKK